MAELTLGNLSIVESWLLAILAIVVIAMIGAGIHQLIQGNVYGRWMGKALLLSITLFRILLVMLRVYNHCAHLYDFVTHFSDLGPEVLWLLASLVLRLFIGGVTYSVFPVLGRHSEQQLPLAYE